LHDECFEGWIWGKELVIVGKETDANIGVVSTLSVQGGQLLLSNGFQPGILTVLGKIELARIRITKAMTKTKEVMRIKSPVMEIMNLLGLQCLHSALITRLPIIKSHPRNPRLEEEIRVNVIESCPQVSSQILPDQLVTRDSFLQPPQKWRLRHHFVRLIIPKTAV
jgi:hypothetical protein